MADLIQISHSLKDSLASINSVVRQYQAICQAVSSYLLGIIKLFVRQYQVSCQAV